MGYSVPIPGLEQTQQYDRLMRTDDAAGTPHILSLLSGRCLFAVCSPQTRRCSQHGASVQKMTKPCLHDENPVYAPPHHPSFPDEGKEPSGDIPELVRDRARVPDQIPNLGSRHDSVPSLKPESGCWIPAQRPYVPSSLPKPSYRVAVGVYCGGLAQLPEMPRNTQKRPETMQWKPLTSDTCKRSFSLGHPCRMAQTSLRTQGAPKGPHPRQPHRLAWPGRPRARGQSP